MDVSMLATALVIAFALGLGALVIYLWQFKSLAGRLAAEVGKERERANALAVDAARLPDALRRLLETESKAAELDRKLHEESVRFTEVSARLLESNEACTREQDLHNHARTELRDEREKLTRAKIELSSAIVHRDAANEQLQQLKSWLETAKESLRVSFLEAASGVFDEKSVLLEQKIKISSDLAKERVDATLKPFSEQVLRFQKQVGDFTEKQRLDAARLDGTITRLMRQNADMTDATGALTKALKGNAKTRGDWGEMILETVLKASGLESGKHYSAQTNTKDEESGANLRPDVIVSFPDNRQIAIDSKVNLVAWAEYNEAQTHEDQQTALIQHTTALRRHVNDLAGKNYPKAIGAQSLDLTVLFVPIEGALAAALSSNPTLQQEAWAKGIAFASPNTLMALLKVAERMWVRDQLQKQVGVIGKHASQLLDTVTAFLADFEAIEGRIAALTKSFSSAKNRLFESDQSVIARTKRLVEAGARGKKRLHESLQPSIEDSSGVMPLLGNGGEADIQGH